MYLIVNEVVELEIIHITDCYGAVELFTCTAVGKLCLGVGIHRNLGEVDVSRILVLVVSSLSFSLFKASSDICLVSAVEYRSHYLPVKCFTSITEVYFKYLTDVHT